MTFVAERNFGAARAATTLVVLSGLSPIAGLAVEMVLAWRFGSSGTVDAFRVASLIVVLGNQLVFGQLLPHVIVPLFSEYRAKGLEQEGWRLAFNVSGLLGFAAVMFSLWVWFDATTLVDLLGPGLAGTGRQDAIVLVQYFSLAFGLIVCSGSMSGILNSYRVFWLPAASQLLNNLILIAAIVTVGRKWGGHSLAIGMLLSGLSMFALHVYYLLRVARYEGIRLSTCLKLAPRDGVRNALWMALPLIGMIVLGQWGIVVINRVLSGMPEGTLATFGYAWKLLLLAGILPSGLATVIFPAFSDAQANENPAEFSRLVMRAFRMTLLLTIPLATVLFVERMPLISLIFERGAMGIEALTETGQLFGILLVGAPAGALSTVLLKVAFSMQDTKSPMIVALLSAIIITWLVPYAAANGGASGVAWVFNAVTWGSTLVLLSYQIARYRVMRASEAIHYSGLLTVLCIGVALPIVAIRSAFELNALASRGMMLLEITLVGIVFIFSGYGLSRLLRVHESSELWRYLRWQMGRVNPIPS